MEHCARSLIHDPVPTAAYHGRERWLTEQAKPDAEGARNALMRVSRLTLAEASFDSIAGSPWSVCAQDRSRWAGLARAWIGFADVSWCSGRQPALTLEVALMSHALRFALSFPCGLKQGLPENPCSALSLCLLAKPVGHDIGFCRIFYVP